MQTAEGRRLRRARNAKDLRPGDVAYLAHRRDGYLEVSHETLRRYEKEVPEEKWNPQLIAVLADIYEIDVERLSPIAAERIRWAEARTKKRVA